MKSRSKKAKGTGLEHSVAKAIDAIPGWRARRQPLSGALIDWPGDVCAEHEVIGKYYVECKKHKSPMAQVRNWMGGCDFLVTNADYERDPVVHLRLSTFLRLLER